MRIVCLALLFCAGLPAAESPVFPQPRQIALRNDALQLSDAVLILLPVHPTAEDLSLARFLMAELSDRYGVAAHMRSVAYLPHSEPFLLLGSARNPLVRQYCTRHGLPPAQVEGYSLDVTASSAVVAGNDDAGAFYGLQSLRQLMERNGKATHIRGAAIRDWPFKPFRAVKLYLPGRDNLAYFRHLVHDVLAPAKYNRLILEMNAGMRLDRHPELNAGWLDFTGDLRYTRRERSSGPGNQFQDSANADTADGGVLEKEEVADLVRYARAHRLDVIPEIPSLTHSYYLLTRHRDLAEIADAEWPDTYCPSEPRVYDLLFDVLDEYIEVMKPAMVHIGHDEWRSPLGVCVRCRGKDPTELFAADVKRIHDHLRAKGIATAMYGDHLIEALRGKKAHRVENAGGAPYDVPGALSPEQVRTLVPRDILIFNWFWDSKPDEDLDKNGIGRRNEVDLSRWGFQQVFGNFEPHIADFDRRAALPGILGGAPSAWAATTELNLGKDVLFSILGCANLLWSVNRPDMSTLSRMVQERLPAIRGRMPSEDETQVPLPLPTGRDDVVPVGRDVSSIAFTHSCQKRGRNEPAFTATWNPADTAGLLGWYEVTYADGLVASIPVRYGVNILENGWLTSGKPRSFAPLAKLISRADSRADFAFEWVNPRFGVIVRDVRLHSTSTDNPITLAGISVVGKRVH